MTNKGYQERKISFLGTCHGMPHRSYCSSLLVEGEGEHLLVDTGGGHDILKQLHRVGRRAFEMTNIFISHTDSDHLLGIVPLVRSFATDKEPRKRTIYCSSHVFDTIQDLFRAVASSYFVRALPFIHFEIIDTGHVTNLGSWKIIFFDIEAQKTPQMGCRIEFSDRKTISFLGDEPMKPTILGYVQKSHIFIHDAFCVEDDADRFHPHKKHHSTVRDAAEHARSANAMCFIPFHMEDKTLESRKERFEKEAKKYFDGEVFVPLDGDEYLF